MERTTNNPQEGDLRVWHIPQVPMEAFRVPVPDLQTARQILNILARYDLFQLEHGVKPDFTNAQGLEVFEGGEWCEWHNKDGQEFDEVMEGHEPWQQAL